MKNIGITVLVIIKHSDKNFLTKEYFDDVERKRYFVEPHIPAFANFKSWSGKKVLNYNPLVTNYKINKGTLIFTDAGEETQSMKIPNDITLPKPDFIRYEEGKNIVWVRFPSLAGFSLQTDGNIKEPNLIKV